MVRSSTTYYDAEHILYPVDGGPLIWLSGADLGVLSKCPTERTKFVGLGGTVLTTAALATVSSTFALVVGVRVPIYFALPIGLLWGLAIMNLDRWLVTATPRREKWSRNLAMVLPRLFLALIIGGVISTPLVLWIFDREISAELKILRQEKASAFEQRLATDERYKGIPDLETEVARLQSIVDGTSTELPSDDPNVTALRGRFNDLDKHYQEAQYQATCEHDGTCGTGVPGAGADYYLKQRYADQLKSERDQVKAQLDVAVADQSEDNKAAEANARQSAADKLAVDKNDLQERLDQRKAEQVAFEERNANSDGLLARLEALSRLTSDNSTLKTAYIALLLFITAIEVLPVLVKFLMSMVPSSLYDRVLAGNDTKTIDAANREYAFAEEKARFEYDTRRERYQAVVTRIGDGLIQGDVEDLRNRMIIVRQEALARSAEVQAKAARRGRWRRRRPNPPVIESVVYGIDGYAQFPADETGDLGRPSLDSAERRWTFDD